MIPAAKGPGHDTPASIWGSELRYYREQAGLSQQDLADRIPWTRSSVQAAESGTRPPTIEMARACDEALEAGGTLVRLREKLLKQAAFAPYFRSWSEIEQEAKVLRGYESVLVPGLLQTPEYARLVLKNESEDAVAARLERQTILTQDSPPSVRFLIEEWVFVRPIGGAAVMLPQLERIEKMIMDGQVHVQVSPAGSVAIQGSFALATLDGETLGYQESTTEGMVMTRRDDVLALEAAYDEIIAEALPTSASLDTIRRMMEQWKT